MRHGRASNSWTNDVGAGDVRDRRAINKGSAVIERCLRARQEVSGMSRWAGATPACALTYRTVGEPHSRSLDRDTVFEISRTETDEYPFVYRNVN